MEPIMSGSVLAAAIASHPGITSLSADYYYGRDFLSDGAVTENYGLYAVNSLYLVSIDFYAGRRRFTYSKQSGTQTHQDADGILIGARWFFLTAFSCRSEKCSCEVLLPGPPAPRSCMVPDRRALWPSDTFDRVQEALSEGEKNNGIQKDRPSAVTVSKSRRRLVKALVTLTVPWSPDGTGNVTRRSCTCDLILARQGQASLLALAVAAERFASMASCIA